VDAVLFWIGLTSSIGRRLFKTAYDAVEVWVLSHLRLLALARLLHWSDPLDEARAPRLSRKLLVACFIALRSAFEKFARDPFDSTASKNTGTSSPPKKVTTR
jgi:hypothetical protein